jgi:Protein of unknown function (DUF1588)/Protein of unknown function (DUF1592)/Protein of unknown function (DUF1585)
MTRERNNWQYKCLGLSETGWLRALTMALLVVLCSCVGNVSGARQMEPASPSGSGGSAGTSPGSTGGAGAEAGGAAQPMATDDVGPAVDLNGNPSALRRLTRDELVTTLTQLTGTSPLRGTLPEEPRSGHGPLLTSGVSFVGVEVEKLYELLGTFARAIAPDMLTKSGCTKTNVEQQTCLLAWASNFGSLALRRALRPNELDSLKSILSGATGVKTNDAEVLQSALTAFFFSPSFLYRPEVGTPSMDRPTLKNLSAEEVAAKISFLATLGAPDAELSAAARGGKLSEATERSRQFVRLSNSPAGAHAQAVMILEWLGANESKFATKGAKYVAGLMPGTEAGLRASAEQFIGRVLASGAGASIQGLLTEKSYLSDPMVAQLTRMDTGGGVNTGDEVSQPRLGLLLHPHVVASHTKDNGSSPFGIGAFVREAILCQPISPPPAGATNMTRNDPPAGLSLREDLEYRTSAGPTCIGCHTQFAPIGYSFIAFDPIGRWIKKDPSGKTWNLSGTTPLYRGVSLPFNSPSELAQNLAADRQVYGCFAQIVLQWSRGRKLIPEDLPLRDRLDALAKSNGGQVLPLLQTIVEDPSFLTAVAAR